MHVYFHTHCPHQPSSATGKRARRTRHGLQHPELVVGLEGVGEAVGVDHVGVQPLRLQPHVVGAPRKPAELGLQGRAVPAKREQVSDMSLHLKGLCNNCTHSYHFRFIFLRMSVAELRLDDCPPC